MLDFFESIPPQAVWLFCSAVGAILFFGIMIHLIINVKADIKRLQARIEEGEESLSRGNELLNRLNKQ